MVQTPVEKDVFKPIDLDATRIALVQFGAQVHNEHLFKDEQTYETVVERIHNIEHLKGKKTEVDSLTSFGSELEIDAVNQHRSSFLNVI